MTDLVYSLAASGRIALAARESGLVRTNDGGKNWHPVYASPGADIPLPATAIALSPQFATDQTVFAAVSGAILRSFDAGITWEMAQLPTPAPYITALVIPVTYAQDKTLFAASLEDGVFRSTNNGTSWNSWNFGLLDLQALSLAISPENTLYVGTGTGLFASRNAGRLWKEIVLPCGNIPILALATVPGLLLVGTEGAGLFASQDDGQTWRQLGNDSLETVNILLAGPQSILALTGEALLFSTGGDHTWQTLPSKAATSPVAIAAPGSIGPGEQILVGFENGELDYLVL